MPEVVQAPAIRRDASMASRPMVSWFATPPGMPRQSVFSLLGRGAESAVFSHSRQAASARGVSRLRVSKPCSTAKVRAPWPTSMVWGVRSMTRRATETA